jgi:hypothetical protein
MLPTHLVLRYATYFQNRPIEEKEVKKNTVVIPKKSAGKKQSWESFLNKNPDRIKK